MKLLAATRSDDKLREIRAILAEVPGLEIVSPEDVGLALHPEEDTIEAFDTFEANAEAKAEWFCARTGLPTVADDSGLEVVALNGAPGVRSKRFAPGGDDRPPEARDRANNEHLLRLLRDRPRERREARYVCVAAYIDARGRNRIFRGEAPGRIIDDARGVGGFGYDPHFLDPELDRTFAELTPAEKDARSHRGRAFRALAQHLRVAAGPVPADDA